jgi:hypothetical protein
MVRPDCAGKGQQHVQNQTRPLVRQDAPQKQDRNCQIEIYIWSWAPDGARHQDLLTDWSSVATWLRLRLLTKDIPYFNVTSGGIRCNKGTPIIKKSPTPPFLSNEEQRKKGKTKVLTLNKYMAMGPSGTRCQEWPCWLVAGSKLLLCWQKTDPSSRQRGRPTKTRS